MTESERPAAAAGERADEPRYCRNLGAISRDEQRTLGEKRVLIVGCGGLGGHILDNLLRLGVGGITVMDCDRFEPSNLNRQLLSTEESLGMSKAEAAGRYAGLVNPSVAILTVNEELTERGAAAAVAGHDLVLDGLDGGRARRALARACAETGTPLIHGAVQGWRAQVALLPPEGAERAMEGLYPRESADGDKSVLPFTAALCAAIQCAEAAKLLLKRESGLKSSLLLIDLLEGESELVSI